MKLLPHDMGDCGSVQMMELGTVNFNDTGVATGVAIGKVPANTIITRAIAVVDKAFNAATTNVLTIGFNDDVNNILGADDITEGTAAAYSKQVFIDCDAEKTVKAKYTQTGTAATAGSARVFLEVVRRPAN